MIAPWLTTLRAARPDLLIVGEVKTESPYGYRNPAGDRRELLAALDEHPAVDVISIHTHSDWGGGWSWLALARQHTSKPILAKGFHNTVKDVRMAFGLGATYCLTVGWWPGDERCWHEAETLEALAYSKAPRVVWNARDPRTGEARPETIETAVNWVNHDRCLSRQHSLCQASMIRSPEDVHPKVQAVLIGEGLWMGD